MAIWHILVTYRDEFFIGLGVTFRLCIIIWSAGIVLGSLLGYLGSRYTALVGIPSRIVSFIISGIPVLVFLFWLHYPLQKLLNVIIDGFYTAAFALSFINTFWVADTIRNAFKSFPEQYRLAGEVCGMSDREITFKIQIPIILRQIIPGVLFTQVAMLQSTLFASLISVEEIFRICQRINSNEYKPVEIYSSLALFFLIICLPLNGIAYSIKKKYAQDFSER